MATFLRILAIIFAPPIAVFDKGCGAVLRDYIFQVAIGRDILCLTELQTFDIRLYDNDGKEVFRLL